MFWLRTLSPFLACCTLLLAQPIDAVTAELKPETLRLFGQYVGKREASLDQRLHGPHFLWAAQSPDRLNRLRQGQVVIETVGKDPTIEIEHGLIHDWVGAIFLPGVKLDQVLRFVQDYDNHKNVYRPEVIDSKLRSRNGNEFEIHLRLLKKKVLTVVLNTEHAVRYFPVNDKRQYSRSYSSKIAEVADAGTPSEKEMPPGKDHGFLWRLNSYWHFEERDGGVYVECEAISLTRGIPFGVGWIVSPIVRDLPRESLHSTLESTRAALSRQR